MPSSSQITAPEERKKTIAIDETQSHLHAVYGSSSHILADEMRNICSGNLNTNSVKLFSHEVSDWRPYNATNNNNKCSTKEPIWFISLWIGSFEWPFDRFNKRKLFKQNVPNFICNQPSGRWCVRLADIRFTFPAK